MNVQRAKKVIKETKVSYQIKKRKLKLHISPASLSRIKSDEWYEQEEIACVAACLMETQDYDMNGHFEIIGGKDQLDKWCAENISNLDDKPYFFIYNAKDHWVVFSVIKHNCKLVVLFKDSFGTKIYPEMEEIIELYFKGEVNFKSHPSKDQKDEHNCGAMALKNLEIMLRELKNIESCNKFIENFETTIFCSYEKLQNVKEHFRTNLIDYVKDNITEFILELSKEIEFIKCVNELIELCYRFVQAKEPLDEYLEIITDESNKKDKDTNYVIDKEKIERGKKKLFKEEQLEDIVKKTTQNFDEASEDKGKATECELDIQRTFPKQMKQFTELFEWLMNIEDDGERDKLLKRVSDELKLEHDRVKAFFELRRTKVENSSQQEKKIKVCDVRNIEQVVEDLPRMKDSSVTPADKYDDDVKDVEKLLEELSLDTC